MDKRMVAKELMKVASLLAADTFKCPDCGTKVLDQTGYCVKCKKKVKEAKEMTAAAPQMGKGTPIWRDIRKGQTFKYKGKTWKKVSQTKAITIPEEMSVRDNILSSERKLTIASIEREYDKAIDSVRDNLKRTILALLDAERIALHANEPDMQKMLEKFESKLADLQGKWKFISETPLRPV